MSPFIGKYIRDYVYGEWEGFRAYNVGTGRGTDVNELESGLRQALEEVLRQQGGKLELPPPAYGPPRPGDLRSMRHPRRCRRHHQMRKRQL
ncbi:MAG: hypothetical protein D9V47_06210 [Clostridia bacterium]|nr:MAG: hypothetical protein D9V47_06210 [Clostridia bacterium]